VLEALGPAFSLVLEASDFESSGGGLDLGGAISDARLADILLLYLADLLLDNSFVVSETSSSSG
jgi:hypothetical protein